MAEKVALVLLRGQTEAIPMSLQRALLAKGAIILTVVNRAKGEPQSKKLFYTKDGKLNAKAQRGMDDPFVNVSKEDTMNIIKPKPRGGDTLRPVVRRSFNELPDDRLAPLEKMDPRKVWVAQSKQATEDFQKQNQGQPSGIEILLNEAANLLLNKDSKASNFFGVEELAALNTLIDINRERGDKNPEASAIRDFMLNDPSSIFSDQRKDAEGDLTRALDLDSKGTGVIPITQGQDSVLKVTARTPSGVEGENEQRLPRRKPKAPTREQKGTPITNRNLRDYYDNIERIQSGPITGETVMIEGSDKIYGGATGKSWQEYSKDWQKENKENIKAGMPEDPIKSLFKKVKEKITSKKGGGRVSSRPKSYRTAKVMKQYAKGGSVRKPNRIK
jgi:hypothetical protein